MHPVDLHAHALKSLVERVGLDPGEIDDVIGGAVGQVGEQSTNTTRWAALAAGFPESVPGVTVDRQCGCSQQALSFAAQGVVGGAYDIAVASGVESMSRVPIGSVPAGPGLRRLLDRGSLPRRPGPQGVSAELIARQWGLSREQLDEFAFTQPPARGRGLAQGWFDRRGRAAQGHPRRRHGHRSSTPTRPSDPAPRSRPWPDCVRRSPTRTGRSASDAIDWKVTAGSSSPYNDGSAALLVTTSEIAAAHGWKPRARIHTATVAADDPIMMLTGIIPATAKVLPACRSQHR